MRVLSIAHVRGTSIDDCAMVGHRHDDQRFHFDDVESWVLRLGPGGGTEAKPQIQAGRHAWYTRLWRSPTGRLFVSQSSGFVHISRADGEGWDSHRLPFVVDGVWGLDDDCVFAWGVTTQSKPLWQWNGQKWREVSSPGHIGAMGGVSTRLIRAVGAMGMVARWDGNSWTQLPT